jgi:pilus assembly protein CpaB
MRILLVILAALIVAGGTGFYVVQGLRPPAPETIVQIETPKLREVYVPARELAAGTIIAPERLSRMEMPESALSGQMIVADADGTAFLAGSVARQVLPQGVPIARSAIVQPGDRGFLAAVLPQGKRAITIPISEVAGIGGLILPGDRVDLILTYSVSGDIIDAEREIRASETVMHNIRVLALDQRLGPVLPDEKDGKKAESQPIASTATLEVTPQQAEVITLGQTLGSLSLVLNSVRDGGEPEEIAARDNPKTEKVSLTSLCALPDALLPRHMTIDSDVTSLLRREIATGAKMESAGGENPVPLPDRTTRVQVVRGIQSQAVQVGLEGSAAEPAAAAAPALAPATE